jgi:hypothetical protein
MVSITSQSSTIFPSSIRERGGRAAEGVLRHRQHEVALADDLVQRVVVDRYRADGQMHRRVEPTVPVTVEYSLTPLGETLIAPLAAIRAWAEGHIGEVLAARAARAPD